jgi:predicted RNA polymerase sigma factor
LASGELVALDEQDRGAWDAALVAGGPSAGARLAAGVVCTALIAARIW